MNQEDKFANRRFWIIGASSGIGAALAKELDRRGSKLVLSARDQEALSNLGADLRNEPVILPLDVSSRAELYAAGDVIGKGQLSGILCLASLYDPSRLAEADPQKCQDIVAVNLLGSIHVSQLAPRLLRKHGKLVLFGSVAGYFGLPRGQAYSATKAAIINLAETLQVEMAPDIDVRLVCPGFVKTRLTDKNEFQMPALVDADQAARDIVEGLARSGFEIHFPKRFTFVMKLMRALPYWLSLRLARRLAR
ncbi:SDR family NAD(P)-dependent oxidoreductase (plasmid) [Qingshengfaniella alkalisoli]|uniref:SDR family NAD(P)-dependent oxidoreductase n=2 Tax=Qingshengfaniella alkalisoli TaxID=2599296 RepID=A0A5B8IYA1_9RHOB|nr:SDR family NAD(P)-dependent oxidoreductase [Qingshengfaniella alkalisoli]